MTDKKSAKPAPAHWTLSLGLMAALLFIMASLTFLAPGLFARVDDPRQSQTLLRKVEAQVDAESLADHQTQIASTSASILRIGLLVASLSATLLFLFCIRRLKTYRDRAERTAYRFHTLAKASAEIILITNAAGTISYISPSVYPLLGWTEDLLARTKFIDWMHADDAALVQSALCALATLHASSTVEFRLRHADGRWLDCRFVIRNLVLDPNICGFVFNGRDVTLDKRAQEVTDFNASHDLLTTLPNRAVLMDRLQKVIERTRRHPEIKAAVLFLDLDDLKTLNDSAGHDAGDSLIVEFGQRLRACVRYEDTVARPRPFTDPETSGGTVARLGGDEFIVLLEEISDPSDAIRVAERIQAAMGEPFVVQGQELFKGVSIGIAFTSPGSDARHLIANADIAMYRAKSNGKSRYEVYDEKMHSQIMRRLDLEKALRRALVEKQFRLYYQPIVSLATGHIAGLEALVRWERPGIGLVPPNEFVPLAEEIGLIVQLGQWVLEEACREAAKWEGIGHEHGPYVSVNASARQFGYPTFVDHVKDALKLAGIDPGRLKIELTEGSAMEDPERAVEVMLKLAEMGVTLSLDDFGTGYSSLSVLRRFPVKTIKIDQSFIQNIHTNTQVAAIVTTICGLARILCMEVVAEGLENTLQLDKLRSISCDFAQGYLFAKPLPADAISEILGVNLIERENTPNLAFAATTGS